jgi:hypothetical protein
MTTDNSQKSGMAAAFLAGAVVVAILIVGITFVLRHTTKSAGPVATPEAHLPFGPDEKQAASHIRFDNIELSAATNLLNQRFTYVTGTVTNDGSRAIEDVEVTIEFRDILNQVALRDTRRVFGPGADPLATGQNRDFSITFESFPNDWNHRLPSIQIVGVQLH